VSSPPGITSPLGDKVHHWGPTSPLGVKFRLRGKVKNWPQCFNFGNILALKIVETNVHFDSIYIYMYMYIHMLQYLQKKYYNVGFLENCQFCVDIFRKSDHIIVYAFDKF
jgi:hypothetical protein